MLTSAKKAEKVEKIQEEIFYYVETLEIIPNSTGNVDIKVLSKELR